VTGRALRLLAMCLINGASQSAGLELHYGSEIECSLILDCKTIKEPHGSCR